MCGDGLKVLYEECDDGNLMNGDGCSSLCFIEDGWSLPGSILVTKCGDGIIV